MLNNPSSEVAEEITTIIVDFMTTPGPDAAARLTTVLSKEVYTPFFNALISRISGLAGATGAETGRLSGALESLQGLLEQLQTPADATVVGGQ